MMDVAQANQEHPIDYSDYDKAIGGLCSPPKSPADWNEFKLTSEQIESFWKDGYLLNVPILTDKQCDKILEDYKYFLGGKDHPGINMLYKNHCKTFDPKTVLVHVLGHWRLTEHFHDIVFLPQVVVPVSQLLEPDGEMSVIRFWHDQLFSKPGKFEGCIGWHQDYSLWTRTSPMKHFTVHIALDDQDESNGALYYIPGSHRWNRNGGPILPGSDFNFKEMDKLQEVLTEEEMSEFKPLCGRLKKGEAGFHHALTVHGSYGNQSDRPRRAAVVNYMKDGVLSNTDEEILKGVHVPKGQKLDGKFFPIVFDPEWVK